MLRPEDACQKRFSWFSGWSPKVQKCVNLVDLVKRFQTSMYLQTLASIQPRTVPSVFEDDPVHQPASQPRTGLSEFAKN